MKGMVDGNHGAKLLALVTVLASLVTAAAAIAKGPPGGGGGGGGGAADPAVMATQSSWDGPLLLMDIDGGNQHATIAHALMPDWSPDGTKAVYVATGASGLGIYTKNIDDSGPEDFVAPLVSRSQANPRWSPVPSPDGHEIAFVDVVDGVPGSAYSRLAVFVVNLDGTGLQQLTLTGVEADLPVEDRHATWSSDGTKLAFVRGWQAEVRVEVHVLSLLDGGHAVVDFSGTELDGLRFSYIDFASGSETLAIDAHGAPYPDDIWLVDVSDPASPIVLSNLTGTPDVSEGGASWCDGDLQLTFGKQNARGKTTVHRINVDGTGDIDIGNAKKDLFFQRCK